MGIVFVIMGDSKGIAVGVEEKVERATVSTKLCGAFLEYTSGPWPQKEPSPPRARGFLVWPVPPLPGRRGGHGNVLVGSVGVFDSECSGKAIVTINN